ncbi:hypothetical protein ATCC90586_005471 [Pythium insidiosum]|nr:hypothetical protein ATCC90586_005471 [Pythium insidiosum]
MSTTSLFPRKRSLSAISTVECDVPVPPTAKRAASFPLSRSLSADAMRYLEENAMPEDAPPHPMLQRQQAVVWCSRAEADDLDDVPIGASLLLRKATSFRPTQAFSRGCATRAVLSKFRF